ncbi:MAG: ComEA family DNA-binding protein [Ruminococcaceae bacterium]|nr:ComEA family DNA-binding protein [Oscillospiraceae bacterium]
MKSNDKIPFDSFVKSEHCLQDDLPRSQGVFKNSERKGKDLSIIALLAVALLSIVFCVFYFKDSYAQVDYNFNASGNNILSIVSSEVSSEAYSEVPSQISSQAVSEASSQVSSGVSTSAEGKININTADIEELCELKYIGEAKALNIVSYRLANGSFKSIEEIKNVKGIGDAIFDIIKDDISI